MSNNKPISDKFLVILSEVVLEKVSYIKTQIPRIKKLWDSYFPEFPDYLSNMEPIIYNQEKFLSDLKYRINILSNLLTAIKIGFILVSEIINFFFIEYVGKSIYFKDFKEEDQEILPFVVAEKLIGSLLQAVSLNYSLIPIKYIIYSQNKSLMKIKELSCNRIHQNLNRSGFEFSIEQITLALNELLSSNVIQISENSSDAFPCYKIVSEISLSNEGQEKYAEKIRPFVEWAIGLWRSLYNLRTLDMPIPDAYPFQEFLTETVSRAATQGFLNAYNVVENLILYYQSLESDENQ